ncbi:nuclear pore protein 84/107 [Dipodascopsis uninucleata]
MSTIDDLMKDQEDGKEIDKFAAVFQKISTLDDPFDLVREFRDIALDRSSHIKNNNGDQEDIETWLLEARTWSLVDMLYSYRTAHKSQQKPLPGLYKLTSNAVAEELFYSDSKAAREITIIISWLRSFLQVPAGPELRGTKWQLTRGQLKQSKVSISSLITSSKRLNVPSAFDLDAPYRENISIHPEDAEFDRSLFTYIFNLIRAGNFSKAQEVCEATGNFSLNAILNGIIEYRDPSIDGIELDNENIIRGTRRKALWRRMCLHIARSPQVDRFEKATFGLLCGDLDSVLTVCDDWETQLFAYLNHLSATQIEEFLRSLGRLNLYAKELQPFPQAQASSISDILNTLSKSPLESIRNEAQHPFRVVQGGIMNEMISMIITDARQKIDNVRDGIEESNIITEEQYILRFLSHLILFLQSIGVGIDANDDAIVVLGAYVEELTVKGKSNLVPLYVSQLPDDAAIEAYSFLLVDISTPEQRREQFELADKYQLDLINTLRRTIQRVFDEHEDEYPTIENYSQINFIDESISDIRLANTLMWYIDARMWDDVVESANALYLRFLLSGKVFSALAFHEKLLQSNLYEFLENYEQEAGYSMTDVEENHFPSTRLREEFQQFEKLIQGFILIKQWNELLSEKPKGNRFDRTWKLRAKDLIEKIKSELSNLIFSWMLVDPSYEKYDVIQQLRVLYIPYVIFELHRILEEAIVVSKRYPKDALEIVNIVTSDDLDITALMKKSGRLDDYLVAIARCSILVSGDPENGIWRV